MIEACPLYLRGGHANRFIESWSVYSNRFAGRSLPEKGGLG